MRAPPNFPHYGDGRPMGTPADWARAVTAARSWYGWKKGGRDFTLDAPTLEEAIVLRAGAWMVKRGVDRPPGEDLPETWDGA